MISNLLVVSVVVNFIFGGLNLFNSSKFQSDSSDTSIFAAGSLVFTPILIPGGFLSLNSFVVVFNVVGPRVGSVKQSYVFRLSHQ